METSEWLYTIYKLANLTEIAQEEPFIQKKVLQLIFGDDGFCLFC